MKVYVAAPFSWKNEMKEFALELESRGIEVTSRWLNEDASPDVTLDQSSDSYHRSRAKIDINDIDRADIVVLMTIDPLAPPKPRGGRHWEAGYAYGQEKEIVIIGPRENVFHYLPGIKVFPTKEKALQFLTNRNKN